MAQFEGTSAAAGVAVDGSTQVGAQDGPAPRQDSNTWDQMIGPASAPVCKHLEPGALLALFQSCPAGRAMVLSTAEHTTIKLPADDKKQVLPSSLKAAKGALVARGKLRTNGTPHTGTKLRLRADGPEQLLQMLGALEEGTTWLDELCVEGTGPLPRHVLAIVGHCCPNLRVLGITAAMDQLPPPALFPKLMELRINDPTENRSLEGDERQARIESVSRAAAPYIKHLAHLTLSSPDYIPTLLSPANIATQLCSLDLPRSLLDDALLGLILQCAPALEQLAVRNIELQTDVHVYTAAKLRELRCHDHSGLYLSSLALFPDTPPGLLLVCPPDALRILRCDTASLDDAAVARLHGRQFRWEGDDDHVYLDYEGGDDPAALRLALSTHPCWVKAEGLTISCGWTMTRELIMELHTGLPHWQRLEFCPGTFWVPEEPHLYASLLRLLPDSYREVTFSCKNYDGDWSSLTPQQVVSICSGAPARTAQAPLRITLKLCPDELYQAIQHTMQQSLIPNVVVVRG